MSEFGYSDIGLRTHHDGWRDCGSVNDQVLPVILDGYHVRAIIATELQRAGEAADDVPETTFATGGLP